MSTRTALLGYTGFVGSNILSQRSFDAVFNSKNIDELADQRFDEITCAAVSAVKWKANQEPDEDWRGIERLLLALSRVRADRIVLISTVDVYPNPIGVFEDYDPSPLPNHPYGTHRLRFERRVKEQFETVHIIRLPGLFGNGIKKNVIYDLINNRELEVINPDSSFQYYSLTRLCGDLDHAVQLGIPLLNLATEPISTREIIRQFFPNRIVGQKAAPVSHYDFRSRHSSDWGSGDGYLYSAMTIREDMARFLALQPGYSLST